MSPGVPRTGERGMSDLARGVSFFSEYSSVDIAEGLLFLTRSFFWVKFRHSLELEP